MTTSSILATLRENSDLLKKHHVRKIGLFGSFARSSESGSSDIDFLVEFDESVFGRDFSGYFDTVTSLHEGLQSLFNRNIDLVTPDMLSPYIAPDVLKEVKFIDEL